MKKSLYCLSLLTVLFLAAIAQAVPAQSNLIFHYRADYLTYADGDEVTSWADSASAAPNATLATRSGYGTPNFVANAYNGLPAVRFERHIGTDNTVKTFLESGNYTFSSPSASNLITIFMVAQQGFTGFTNRTFHVGEKAANANNCIEIDLRPDADGAGGVGMGCRTNGGRVCAYSSFNQGDWHISAHRIQDGQQMATYNLWVDGVAVTTFGTTSLMDFLDDDADTYNTMGFGTDKTGAILDNEAYQGDIAEVLVYNYLSNDDDVTAVYNFLYNKYNNLMAHNPTPAKQSVDQGEVVLVGSTYRTKLQLGWDTGHATAGSETFNPAIQYHYVYWAESEPNLYAATTPNMIVAAGSNSATTGDILIEPGTKHYWRVDEVWAATGGEPNCVTGDVWTVTPMRATPRILTQPTSIKVFPGEEAWLEPVILSPSTPSFQWYKTPDNSNSTTTDDTAINAPAGTLQRLSIPNAQLEHEGYYYCAITNAASVPGSPSLTGVRMIGIKREMGHWTMNSADYVGGQFLDSSTADTTDYDATSNVADAAQFVTGQYTGLAQGYNFAASPQAAAKTASFWGSPYTDNVTVSAWIKWNGATGSNQGIVCQQGSTVDPATVDAYWLDIRSDYATLRFDIQGTGVVSVADPLTTGQWYHVVATCGPAGLKIYLDGELNIANTTRDDVPRNAAPIYIGARDSDATGMLLPFNGAIDDVRIFNYEMDMYGVIALYSEMSGAAFCVNKDNLDMRFDKNNDCFVDMADFAEFAADWLACGIYPDGCL